MVLNANPNGDNQYSNPDGKSSRRVLWGLPKKPTVPIAKVAKGLAKQQTVSLIDKTTQDLIDDGEDENSLDEHHLHVMKKILEGKVTRKYKKYADYSSPSRAHKSISRHLLAAADAVRRVNDDSELAAELSKRAREHVRASDAYELARRMRKLPQDQYLSRVSKVDSPYEDQIPD
jgi:hypothetical protein